MAQPESALPGVSSSKQACQQTEQRGTGDQELLGTYSIFNDA